MITSYNQLPLGRYLDILALGGGDLQDVDYCARVLSILTDLPEDDLLDQPIAETQKLARGAAFLLDELPAPSGKRLPASYVLGGMELAVCRDVRKWSTAQFVDYQNLAKDKDLLVELYSCVLVPKGLAYCKDYDIADVQAAIRDCLPVTAAREISAFFLRKFERSLRTTLISSLPILRRSRDPKARALARSLADSMRSGTGWRPLTGSAKRRG